MPLQIPPSAARTPAVRSSRERLAHAQALIAGGHLEQAEQLLMSELARPASRAEANFLLAAASVIGKRPEVAASHARAAVQLAPTVARYWFALGRALKSGGNVEGAAQAYRRAIELEPSYAEAHVSLGITFREAGDLDEAIACYRRAIEIEPRLAVAHVNLALAIEARAIVEAEFAGTVASPPGLIESTEAALALDPRNAALHRTHGVLLLRAGRRGDAIVAFNRALGLEPSDVESCLRLGACLVATGFFESATLLYERWLQHNPPSPAVMRQLAARLALAGRAAEALQWAQRTVALDGSAPTHFQIGNALQQCRRLPEALEALQRAVEIGERRPSFYGLMLFVLNYLYDDPDLISERHAEYGRAVAADMPQRPQWQRRPRGPRLRVGYVSADFVQHSVAFFVEPLLQHHDLSRFEVFCYYNRAFGDSVTERLKALGHHWIDCSALSDALLAQRIHDDAIDVLVDLGGHTGGARLTMFHFAPAPVQITYLGYPTVTGLQAMDFRITDRVIDPGDDGPLASDRPLRLPRSMFCFRPGPAPAIGSCPHERNGVVTFGSFNNLAKVTDATLRLWASVLHAVPQSRLLLKAASLAEAVNRDNVLHFMAALGIEPARLRLQGQVAEAEGHLALYNEVDVALDTYPYNGATTTCEALWMGVPVVSLCGRTHASRMGASILAAAGRPEWVAHDEAGFVDTAVALAAGTVQRAAWRAQAREALASSELMDETGFARSFEALLEQVRDRAP